MKQYKINDVTITEHQIKKLLKENPELKEEKLTRWKPELNEGYWFVDCYGMPDTEKWENAIPDLFMWRSGNCFKTQEEARKALTRQEAINTVTLAIEEANDGWVPNWSNYYDKHYIHYYHDDKRFVSSKICLVQIPFVLPYMKSKDIACQIIEDYEEELKIIFEIE